jgi:hypothetical protein
MDQSGMKEEAVDKSEPQQKTENKCQMKNRNESLGAPASHWVRIQTLLLLTDKSGAHCIL